MNTCAYILVDCRSVKKGGIAAIQYPAPFLLVLFMDKEHVFSASDKAFMDNDDIVKINHIVETRDVQSLSLMMSMYVGEIFQKDDVREIFVVSGDQNMGAAFEKITHGVKPRLVRYIAELPVEPCGELAMTRKVREARMSVMAAFVCALFSAFIIGFLFLISTYGGDNVDANTINHGLSSTRILMFDFGSYVLPGIAAVSAGIGLFTKRWEGFFTSFQPCSY